MSASGGKAERIRVEIPKQSRTYVEHTPQAERERARRIFHAGNKAFEHRQIDRALRLYQKAYAIWPHPRILFNQAVSLGFLGRPLESARTFRKVLEYGPKPISALRYRQAVERYMELMGQLSSIVISCRYAGAKVFVDGEPVGTAPLEDQKVTVGPGTHMVTASKRGKVPYQAQIRLAPGQRKRLRIELQNYTELVRYKHVPRYHWAWPTAVSAVAAALAATGVGTLVSGRNIVGDIQDSVDRQIRENGTSVPFTYNVDRESRGVGLQQGGWALIGVAGVAAGTALVLWLVRKKRVRYTAAPAATGLKIQF